MLPSFCLGGWRSGRDIDREQDRRDLAPNAFSRWLPVFHASKLESHVALVLSLRQELDLSPEVLNLPAVLGALLKHLLQSQRCTLARVRWDTSYAHTRASRVRWKPDASMSKVKNPANGSCAQTSPCWFLLHRWNHQRVPTCLVRSWTEHVDTLAPCGPCDVAAAETRPHTEALRWWRRRCTPTTPGQSRWPRLGCKLGQEQTSGITGHDHLFRADPLVLPLREVPTTQIISLWFVFTYLFILTLRFLLSTFLLQSILLSPFLLGSLCIHGGTSSCTSCIATELLRVRSTRATPPSHHDEGGNSDRLVQTSLEVHLCPLSSMLPSAGEGYARAWLQRWCRVKAWELEMLLQRRFTKRNFHHRGARRARWKSSAHMYEE